MQMSHWLPYTDGTFWYIGITEFLVLNKQFHLLHFKSLWNVDNKCFAHKVINYVCSIYIVKFFSLIIIFSMMFEFPTAS